MGRPDKIPITREKKVSYSGYFQAFETYSYLKDFMEEVRHYDVTERDLAESNDGKKITIKTKIDAAQQYNDYYMLNIRFLFMCEGKFEDIEIDGKVKKYVKGEAQLIVSSWIVPDYLDKRDYGPLGQFVAKVYDKFLGVDELHECIGSVNVDVGELIGAFKKQMNTRF